MLTNGASGAIQEAPVELRNASGKRTFHTVVCLLPDGVRRREFEVGGSTRDVAFLRSSTPKGYVNTGA